MAARSSSVTWMYCAPPSPPSPAPAPSSSPNWSRSASTPSPSSTPSWRKSTNSCWLRSMSCGGCVALLSAFVRALRTRSRRLEGGATHRQQFRVARAELLQERLEERRVLLHERAQLAHDGRVAQLRQLARVTSGTGTGTCSCRLGRRTRGGSGFEEVAGGVGGGGCEGRPSQRAPQRRESSHAPGAGVGARGAALPVAGEGVPGGLAAAGAGAGAGSGADSGMPCACETVSG